MNHVSKVSNPFKQHFNTNLENKPANPPDFDVYEAMIASKAAEANKAIDNTAGASAQQKQRAKNEVGSTSHTLIMACNAIHLQDNTSFYRCDLTVQLWYGHLQRF